MREELEMMRDRLIDTLAMEVSNNMLLEVQDAMDCLIYRACELNVPTALVEVASLKVVKTALREVLAEIPALTKSGHVRRTASPYALTPPKVKK